MQLFGRRLAGDRIGDRIGLDFLHCCVLYLVIPVLRAACCVRHAMVAHRISMSTQVTRRLARTKKGIFNVKKNAASN
jgi:hypothetical protein